jgi:hypothetical protein
VSFAIERILWEVYPYRVKPLKGKPKIGLWGMLPCGKWKEKCTWCGIDTNCGNWVYPEAKGSEGKPRFYCIKCYMDLCAIKDKYETEKKNPSLSN